MRIEALEAWFREVTGFFVFYLLVPPWLYLFSLVVYHLLSFLTTEGLRDHWGGNPGDKSGAFVISSGSLWEMKTITKNKYFCQDKGHKHLGGRSVYKDGRSGPKISSGSEYIATGCLTSMNWTLVLLHLKIQVCFFYLKLKGLGQCGYNDYIDVQM